MFMIMTATAAIMVMMMPFFMGVTMFTAVVMAFLTVVMTAHFMLFFMIVTAAVVFFIVIHALAQRQKGGSTNMGSVIVLYLVGTFLAALSSVVASFLFPSTLLLPEADGATAAPGGIGEVRSDNGARWMNIGSGDWDSQGRPSEVRLDRIIRIDPNGIRREGAIMDRGVFALVAAEFD